MFRIDFFVLNSNPMSASWKSLSIFVDSVNVSDDIVYKNEANNNNKSTDVFKNDSINKYI